MNVSLANSMQRTTPANLQTGNENRDSVNVTNIVNIERLKLTALVYGSLGGSMGTSASGVVGGILCGAVCGVVGGAVGRAVTGGVKGGAVGGIVGGIVGGALGDAVGGSFFVSLGGVLFLFIRYGLPRFRPAESAVV